MIINNNKSTKVYYDQVYYDPPSGLVSDVSLELK